MAAGLEGRKDLRGSPERRNDYGRPPRPPRAMAQRILYHEFPATGNSCVLDVNRGLSQTNHVLHKENRDYMVRVDIGLDETPPAWAPISLLTIPQAWPFKAAYAMARKRYYARLSELAKTAGLRSVKQMLARWHDFRTRLFAGTVTDPEGYWASIDPNNGTEILRNYAEAAASQWPNVAIHGDAASSKVGAWEKSALKTTEDNINYFSSEFGMYGDTNVAADGRGFGMLYEYDRARQVRDDTVAQDADSDDMPYIELLDDDQQEMDGPDLEAVVDQGHEPPYDGARFEPYMCLQDTLHYSNSNPSWRVVSKWFWAPLGKILVSSGAVDFGAGQYISVECAPGPTKGVMTAPPFHEV